MEPDLRKLKAKKNPINNYSMIHRSITSDKRLTHAQFRLFVYLMSYDPCFPSYQTIVSDTGLSRATIAKGIKRLVELDYLEYEKGQGTSNSYALDGYGIEADQEKQFTERTEVVHSVNRGSSLSELEVVHSVNPNRINKNNNKNNNKKTADADASVSLSGESCKKKEATKKGSFDFETPYQEYPRKKGKQAGIKRLQSTIKSQKDYDDFCKAVKNYADECYRKNIDPKYIRHFSSFVTDWRDWLEVDLSPKEKAYQALAEELLADDWD